MDPPCGGGHGRGGHPPCGAAALSMARKLQTRERILGCWSKDIPVTFFFLFKAGKLQMRTVARMSGRSTAEWKDTSWQLEDIPNHCTLDADPSSIEKKSGGINKYKSHNSSIVGSGRTMFHAAVLLLIKSGIYELFGYKMVVFAWQRYVFWNVQICGENFGFSCGQNICLVTPGIAAPVWWR